MPNRTLPAAVLALLACTTATAAPIAIVNAGFESLYQGNDVQPGTFPTGPAPAGWATLDPNGVVGNGAFVGVLNPGTFAADGATFFPGGAAEGDNVALLYMDGGRGGPAYGIRQVLGATLAANVDYTLSVAVGNIASGTGLGAYAAGGFFNLDGFPGYQVQLLAGGVLLAQDDSSLLPGEGTFATSVVQFSAGAGHALLGQQLEIRLINLGAAGGPNARGVEVDFDDVRLDAAARVPLPASAALLLAGIGALALGRRARA